MAAGILRLLEKRAGHILLNSSDTYYLSNACSFPDVVSNNTLHVNKTETVLILVWWASSCLVVVADQNRQVRFCVVQEGWTQMHIVYRSLF